MNLLQKAIAAVVQQVRTYPLRNCWRCGYSIARYTKDGPNVHVFTIPEDRRIDFYCLLDEQQVAVDGGCAAWARGLDMRCIDLDTLSAHEKAALLFKKASTYEAPHRDRV